MNSPKLVPYIKAKYFFKSIKKKNLSIAQCHGTFDLLHPGHILHLEEAKKLCDLLVVTITSEDFVNKGPGRPYFNDDLRVKTLCALECVDYVVLIPFAGAVEAITCVQPEKYCKGKEYEDSKKDVTGEILNDIKTVEKFGGKMFYIGSVTFSSTNLLNKNFATYPSKLKSFFSEVSSHWNFQEFREIVDSFSELKVLIVGDTIIDKYTTVSVQGLTSKNSVISSRFISDESQPGGALAVLRHVKQFAPNVKLFSLSGTEKYHEEFIARYLHPEEDLIIRESDFTSIVKHRFIQPMSKGKEITKFFSVNYIDEHHPSESLSKRVKSSLEKILNKFDLVIVMDFGHGLISESVRRLLEENAPFLALNCQTNSNNFGFNIINHQYKRADSFSLDQTEMNLACGKQNYNAVEELEKLHISLNSSYAWLTRGSVNTIGIDNNLEKCSSEPFQSEVVDTIGAGDAFSALVSLCAVKNLPLNLSTFMGQLAGAIAVKIVGNRDPVTKSKFLKSAEAMLNCQQ